MDDLAVLTHCLDLFSDVPVRRILHVAAPIEAPHTEAHRSTAADISRRCREGSVAIWSGGWSGACAHLLLPEELRWELAWSRTSDEGTGFLQLFGVVPDCSFPHSPTRSQVERLAEGGAVCAGYELDSPAAAPGAGEVGDLWFFHRGRWGRLRSRFMPANATESVPAASTDAIDVTHLVLPTDADGSVQVPDEATVALVKQQHAGGASDSWMERLQFDREPERVLFGDGRPTTSRWTVPDEVAGLISARSDRAPHREHTRRILSIVAQRSDPQATTHYTAMTAPPHEDRFGGRDVQGGITGRLSLDDEETTIHFAAGRFCGLRAKEDRADSPRRAQGFVQYHPEQRGPVRYATRYLETETAAWFTAESMRGIRETATLDGLFHVESTAFVLDDRNGLILNFAVTRLGAPPDRLYRLNLLEIPLVAMEDESDVTAAVLEPAGATTPFRLTSRRDDRIRNREGEQPHDAVAVGSAVRIEPGGRPLSISAIDPRGTVTVPFCFSVRRSDEGAFLAWHPFGLICSSRDAIFRAPFWTSTYRLSLGDEISGDVAESLRSEIDGFTTSAEPSVASR